MKDARFDIFPQDQDDAARRIEARMALRLPATLHIEGRPQVPVSVTDITTRGCRIETGRRLEVAAPVTLMIAGTTMIGGRIAWREGEACGIDFHARLLPKAITAMLLRSA